MTASRAEPTSSAHERLGRVLPLGAESSVVPGTCACCGDVAATSRKESAARREIVVPYCDRCLRHASAGTTRALAATLASALVAVTLTLSAPLLWPHAQLFLQVASTTALSSLPLLLRFWLPKARSPHTAIERAVWWQRDGGLCCTHPRWAEELARCSPSSRVPALPARLRPPLWTHWMATGPTLALVLGTLGWYLHHPTVRIVNLSAESLTVRIDDRVAAVVDPTSAESPAAGTDIRAPAGMRHLVAQGRLGPIADSLVSVESGALHLYAPGSQGYCFWLEETAYGRATAPAPVTLLGGESRFWVLPRRIDTWFAPNPPAAGDRRSSGGSLVALRQAPCAQAPPGARP